MKRSNVEYIYCICIVKIIPAWLHQRALSVFANHIMFAYGLKMFPSAPKKNVTEIHIRPGFEKKGEHFLPQTKGLKQV